MSGLSNRMVSRRVLPLALERLLDDPVVLLEGPRSVGKSTLLWAVAEQASARLLDLDDPALREAVAADPATFASGPSAVCVDEYQKAPIGAGRDAGLDHSTAESYARLLEAVFLTHRLPAWGTTLGSRATASPKVFKPTGGQDLRLYMKVATARRCFE